MTGRQKKSRGFSIYMTIMIILLMLAVALLIYGSATNGLVKPVLPGKSMIGMGTMLQHG